MRLPKRKTKTCKQHRACRNKLRLRQKNRRLAWQLISAFEHHESMVEGVARRFLSVRRELDRVPPEIRENYDRGNQLYKIQLEKELNACKQSTLDWLAQARDTMKILSEKDCLILSTDVCNFYAALIDRGILGSYPDYTSVIKKVQSK